MKFNCRYCYQTEKKDHVCYNRTDCRVSIKIIGKIFKFFPSTISCPETSTGLEVFRNKDVQMYQKISRNAQTEVATGQTDIIPEGS